MGLARQRHSKRSARVDEGELCPRHSLYEHGLGQQTAYELISNEPVSYTHLDVYKRQFWDNASLVGAADIPCAQHQA